MKSNIHYRLFLFNTIQKKKKFKLDNFENSLNVNSNSN